MPDEWGARKLIEAAPINSVPTRNHPPEVIPLPDDLAPSVGGASEKPVSSQVLIPPHPSSHRPSPTPLGASARPRVGAHSTPLHPCGVSSQAAFGAVMLELARGDSLFAERLLTMAPDVTTTTSLAGFVNKRGVFTTGELAPDFIAMPQP